MSFVENPLDNPGFLPVVYRLAATYAAAFVLIVLINARDLAGMFRTSLWKRYQAWLIMGPAFILCILLGGIPAMLFAALIMFASLKEYSAMLKLPRGFAWLVAFNGLISIVAAVIYPSQISLLPYLYFVTIVLYAVVQYRHEGLLTTAAYSLFGSLWICFSLTHIILFEHLEGGTNLLLLLAFGTISADTFALFIGKASKKLKLDYQFSWGVSPGKTYAGAVGSLIGAGVGVLIFNFLLPAIDYRVVVLILIMGLGSILGDLVESMVKRSAGVKDSSNAIPGHGGVLDRVDSFLVVVVVGYYAWLAMSSGRLP